MEKIKKFFIYFLLSLAIIFIMKVTWMDVKTTKLIYFILCINIFSFFILTQLLNDGSEKFMLLGYLIGDLFIIGNYNFFNKLHFTYLLIVYVFLFIWVYLKKRNYVLLLIPILVTILKFIYIWIYFFIYYNEINEILSAIPR